RFRYDECSICFDKFEENCFVYQLKCSHLFHLSCLCEWLMQKTSCPLCRSQTESIWRFRRLFQVDNNGNFVCSATIEAIYV
ncbi:hypothetical protein HELRODRAFT_73840, partial [Helobdella robusta]|uniref:RING-type domain-containing protein n=1 Tax=Helobdella robusta TaxID=6412 RepID=T1G1J0_HELRO